MDALRDEGPEVPHCVWVSAISLGHLLLRVDEVRELHRIADEEDGGVVAHHIEVTLLRVELHSKATRVTIGIRSASLSSHRAESQEHGSPLADLVQERGLAVLGDVLGNLEEAMGSSPLRMNHTLRDTLTNCLTSAYRSKAASLSIKGQSEIKTGPYSPAVREFWLSSMGIPVDVVKVFFI